MSDEVKQCPCGKCHCPFCGNQMKRDALKAENERLKTEAKALKGNWAGTWVNECELNDLLKERDQLRAMCEKMAKALRKALNEYYSYETMVEGEE